MLLGGCPFWAGLVLGLGKLDLSASLAPSPDSDIKSSLV